MQSGQSQSPAKCRKAPWAMDMALKKSSIIIIIIITSGYFVSFWGVAEGFRENTHLN